MHLCIYLTISGYPERAHLIRQCPRTVQVRRDRLEGLEHCPLTERASEERGTQLHIIIINNNNTGQPRVNPNP